MKRLLSGIQPSGQLHIGNYLGALKQWVELQDRYDCFFFLADYHALTSQPTARALHENIDHTAAMLLAVGLDPKSTTMFFQSQLPQHTELGWILSNQVGLGQLNRMTQFKEKSDRLNQNVGLYTYPTLMAADILLYQAEVVPVGEDQIQHLELTREVARSFNKRYGQTFTEPKPVLNHFSRIMALNDPSKKMSKSVPGSAIGLLDSDEEIAQAIRRAVTDSDPNSTKMSPAVANLFTLLEAFGDKETFTKFETKQKEGKLRYSELKEQLTEDITASLTPIRKAYQSLISDRAELRKIYQPGNEKARQIAQESLEKIKKTIGIL